MIKILRVDERLLHGQVAVTWTNAVGVDCILVATDHLDPIVQTTIKLSKPAGVKLVIKNIADSIEAINTGRTAPYQLFILVENVTDAYRLAKGCPDHIKSINIGRTKKLPGTEPLNKETHVTPEERQMLRELSGQGLKIELQMIPSSKAVPVEKVL